MNKKQLVFLVLVVSVGLAANAQQGGYRGPGTTPVTVKEAENLRRASFVILQGKITRLLFGTNYLFSDDTGELTVIIQDRLWGDVSVDENDTVEIRGLVFKGGGTIGPYYVTVESIRKL